MSTGVLFGQIAMVLGAALAGVWAATQWTAAALGFQARLGLPWFELWGIPIYHPWRLFEWWYFYDAYAPAIFLRGGTIAASSGVLATSAAHRDVGLAFASCEARQDLRIGALGRA